MKVQIGILLSAVVSFWLINIFINPADLVHRKAEP